MRELFSTRQVEAAAGVSEERLETWVSRYPVLFPQRLGSGALRVWTGANLVAACVLTFLRGQGVPLSAASHAVERIQREASSIGEARAVARRLALAKFREGLRYPRWKTVDVSEIDALRRADAIETAIAVSDYEAQR